MKRVKEDDSSGIRGANKKKIKKLKFIGGYCQHLIEFPSERKISLI
ncbi:MAG: hypothetical protein M1130_06085 [Actinobacteria bacterium]|nr:hypothetical protein [Actinomycetota bacterium]